QLPCAPSHAWTSIVVGEPNDVRAASKCAVALTDAASYTAMPPWVVATIPSTGCMVTGDAAGVSALGAGPGSCFALALPHAVNTAAVSATRTRERVPRMTKLLGVKRVRPAGGPAGPERHALTP